MSTPDQVPELVSRALRTSLSSGWQQTTRHESGRLLATLAASRRGIVAEIGTGSGAGVAWLRSGAPASTRVVCVEQDPQQAERAAQALAGAEIDVLVGGCEVLRRHAPFSLLYFDRGVAETVGLDLAWELVADGGMVVVDDFLPDTKAGRSTEWSCTPMAAADPVRQDWLSDARFTSTEVSVAADVSMVIATRRAAA
ncbi:O-methyltransferase [Luteococcus peritonei]|uniref:O-methyltransferase n=1 Tax=Luteococcus peritonei TaxID=88874 RepID=A0ABW4RT79_9ACTN